MVLMFSHYVNHLECTGSLEGHRTLMVHECLVVAAALGRYHRWQRRVSHQDRDTYDWTKVPVVPKDDFRQKYSPALTLLGNAQNPTYAHPKLLGRCFDNVYFCGWIIGDLPARGRSPHSEERTKLIYDQEYEELVHRLENTLDLTLESPSYSMVPTSLVNPDIVLPHQEFRKRRGLLELPSGRGPEQREYTMDGARGLIDLDWSQRTPIFHPDDIDRDPRFTSIPTRKMTWTTMMKRRWRQIVKTHHRVAPVTPVWPHRPILGVIATTHRRHIRYNRLKVKLWDHRTVLTQTLIWQWRWVV